METRVKERLIGAVILVALIVVLVPEILSGPHRRAGSDRSASSEPPLRTYTIDLSHPELRTTPAESVTEPGANSLPKAGLRPEAPRVPTVEAPPPRRSEAVPSNSREPSEKRTAPRSTEPPAPRAPRTERAGETAAPPAVTSGWAVQLGSFSSAENAERLARELRAAGYKAFVARFESAGQKRLRVRVGPEQERARAEQLAERLRREGRQATVVTHP